MRVLRTILLGSLVLAAFPAVAQSDVRLPSLVGGPGTDLVVPVRVNPPDGVSSVALTIDFDPAVVQATAVYATPFAADLDLVADLSIPGTVAISLAGAPPLPPDPTGDPRGAAVAWVNYRVVGPIGSSTPLLVTLAEVDGQSAPFVDGQIDVLGTDATVSMPDDANALPGTTGVVIPVSTTPIAGALGIDITVEFDERVLQATGVSKTALTQSMTLTPNLTTPGQVRISLFVFQAVSGSGPLVNITFDVIGDLGDATPFEISQARINEGLISTALDDGLFVVCAGQDLDGDGFSDCAGDCNDGNDAVFPGNPEVCDTLDNDCNGLVDDLVGAGDPVVLDLDGPANDTTVSWIPQGAPFLVDVVRGRLVPLRDTAGDFAVATEICLGNDQGSGSLNDGDIPGSGDAYWYLGRGGSCGDGTYDSTGLNQAAPRDAGVDGSPGACPSS